MYVLKLKGNNNKYVAISGHKESYTSDIKFMQTYKTEEDAIKDSCVESEYPVNTDYLFTINYR